MPARMSLRSAPRLALCTLILTGGGCSFAFVDGPPAKHAHLPYFECSSSNAWPVIDTVIAASLGAGAAAAIADGGSSSNGTTDAVIAGAEAALFAVSALAGYQKVAACREAKGDLIARLGVSPHYDDAPRARKPPPDPWLTPPPGLFAPRAPRAWDDADKAGGADEADEPDATTTKTPDVVPVPPPPASPAPAVDAETPR